MESLTTRQVRRLALARAGLLKPAKDRLYGYYCLPVLAGDRFVARVDLKCDRRAGKIEVLSRRFEDESPTSARMEAVRTAVERHGRLLGMTIIR